MSCEWCEKIEKEKCGCYLSSEHPNASEYIYYDGEDFMYSCEDSFYDFSIKYCPNCGEKLEIKNEEV